MTSEKDAKRADWRFLLPSGPGETFRHLVLFGGPPALPELVLKLGIARTVSREIPPEGCADAVVLLEDAPPNLSRASRCLAPGGALYWEVRRTWRTWFSTTPGAIRRRIMAEGLTPSAIHWPRPSFSRAAMYLPVGHPGVFRWYVETLLEARTFPRRVARHPLRLLTRRGAVWSSAFIPRFSVTATAGAASRRSTPVWEPVRTRPSQSSSPSLPAVLCGGDFSRRVIVFPFSRDAGDPEAVVKLWRLPHRNVNSEAEQSVLRRIRSRLDGSMQRTIPEPLGTVRWGNSLAAIESYAPGPPLSHRLNGWGRRLGRKMEDVDLVFDWLASFHRQARLRIQTWDPAAIQQWVQEPIARHRSAFGATPEEERLFALTRDRAMALSGSSLPIVWAHPDLTAANIHVDGRRITVIDWSGATGRLPLFDLLYFAVLVTCRVRRLVGAAGRLRCFEDLFIRPESDDRIVAGVRKGISRYLGSLQVDSRFYPLLLVLSWLARSLECFDRAEAVARGVPGANPHPEEFYGGHLRILAANAEELFGEGKERA